MINYRLKIDHDFDPCVDDIFMPNGQEEIILLQINKLMQNDDGRYVASVKKCSTYYPKSLPLKLIFFFTYLVVKFQKQRTK